MHPCDPSPRYLYLSTLVLAQFTTAMVTGLHTITTSNLRHRMTHPIFRGFAFITFKANHCLGYFYDARLGTLTYVDGLGGAAPPDTLDLVRFIVKDLDLPLPESCVRAPLPQQGRASGSCNIVAQSFIEHATGLSTEHWGGEHCSVAFRNRHLRDVVVYELGAEGVSRRLRNAYLVILNSSALEP